MDMEYFTPEQIADKWIKLNSQDEAYIYFDCMDGDDIKQGYCDLAGFIKMQETKESPKVADNQAYVKDVMKRLNSITNALFPLTDLQGCDIGLRRKNQVQGIRDALREWYSEWLKESKEYARKNPELFEQKPDDQDPTP